MAKVTSREFQKEFGRYRVIAHREPVTITNHGRDDLVVVSAEEYSRLKSLDRQALFAAELSDELLDELGRGRIPEAASRFDDEYEP